jgi:hypothetical protein
MKNILVVEKLNIFNIFVALAYRIFRFEVHFFKISERIVNWRLIKFLPFRQCSFEECKNIDFKYIVGKNGDSIDKITNEILDSDLLNIFIPFLINIKDSQKKNKLLLKEYVLHRCSSINDIYTWIDGYFIDFTKNEYKIYLLGNICNIGARFLEIRSDNNKVIPLVSSNSFIVFSILLKVFGAILRKVFFIINKAIPSYSNNNSQFSLISNNISSLKYSVLYFPHRGIFYGDLLIKDNFYSKDSNSVFFPSNILHVELENISLTKVQHNYYKKNNIETVIFPKSSVGEISSILFYVLSEIGFKKTLFFLKKDSFQFFVFLRNTVKFLSTRALIEKYYKPKLVLVGYEILFPLVLSLAFESLKIKTIATQERFLPTFFSYIFFFIDTYLCNSELVRKTINNSDNKIANNCIPCGQIRTDLLFEFQENNNLKNDRFTIVAFDYHSDTNSNNNRLEAIINWKANASFYRDLCNLAKLFPQIDIIVRGKNNDWTKIPFFNDILTSVDRIPNIWIDSDYSRLNKQYELASYSDLVIAKPTSIADEVLALGKRVIFYDYFPNSSHHFASEYFNYRNYNIFAFSFHELHGMVELILNGGELLTETEILDLQIMTNNIPADGKAHKRVMKILDTIYSEVDL